MKVVIVSSWEWAIEMPSQIFPLRLARAFHKLGDIVIGIEPEHEWSIKRGTKEENKLGHQSNQG